MRRDKYVCLLILLIMLLLTSCVSNRGPGFTSVVVRKQFDSNTMVALYKGRTICLECTIPSRWSASEFLAKYLNEPGDWNRYLLRSSATLRFELLKPAVQKAVLMALFPRDRVDEGGWWHTTLYSNNDGVETVASMCEWLTGNSEHYHAVLKDKRNNLQTIGLVKGQVFVVDTRLLKPAFRLQNAASPPVATGPRPPDKTPDQVLKDEQVRPDAGTYLPSDLKYGKDGAGEFAEYQLKQGEALYSAVIVRFTDINGHDDVSNACEVIQRRSAIRNVHAMKAGQRILIPMDMLSDRYKPEGNQDRREYEEAVREAGRLKKDRVRSKELDGVVVVLDPGHGGRDHGASNQKLGLHEDEINYDIVCRAKQILETTTRAKVYVTQKDRNQGFQPSSATRFTLDTDEELLTSPPYDNSGDAKVSANLRWYLSNSIFRKEVAKGVDPRKVIFASIHTDALFNERLQGTMIYIPGARYRRDSESYGNSTYGRFAEYREHPNAASTESERRRDEALSRNFAEMLVDALGDHRPPITVNRTGDPIRSQIRQSGGKVYVPAVLRNNQIPAKILVETANICSSSDCRDLSDPSWREGFAEALVTAIRNYYN